MATGATWEEQRMFLCRQFHALGVGRRSLIEAYIQEEVEDFIRMIEETNRTEGSVQMDYNINIAVTNIIWRIATGKQGIIPR